MKGDFFITEQIILWDTKYGKVHCKLKDVMQKRKLNIYQLVRLTDLKYEVIRRYYDDKVIKYDNSVLSKLCYTLDCQINDLMQYERSEW